MTAARPLLLVGAGGLARESLELIRAVNRAAPTWSVLGLLDDDPELHGRRIHGIPVLGPAETVHEHPDAALVASVASPDDPLRRLASSPAWHSPSSATRRSCIPLPLSPSRR